MKKMIISLLFVVCNFATHDAEAAVNKQLPWGGFVVLNNIDSDELNLGFNNRIFWDNTVCGFVMVHAGDTPGGVLGNAVNEFELTGSTSLNKSMLPIVDQMIFKVSEEDRSLAHFILKTKNGKSIKDVIGSMNLGVDDQVVIMFSRNCVGMP